MCQCCCFPHSVIRGVPVLLCPASVIRVVPALLFPHSVIRGVPVLLFPQVRPAVSGGAGARSAHLQREVS